MSLELRGWPIAISTMCTFTGVVSRLDSSVNCQSSDLPFDGSHQA